MTDDNSRRSITRRDLTKAAGAGLTTGLAGCIGGLGGGSSNSNSNKIAIWSSLFNDSSNDSWVNWYEKTYRENHPNANFVTTAYQYATLRKKFLTGARTGTPGAIETLSSHTSEYIAADLVEPLTEEVKEVPFFDGYIEGAREAMTFKGELWGFPYIGNGRALIYRKDIFDKYGLEPPNTTEAFLKAGRTIYKNEDDMNGFHNCTKDGSIRAFQEWISHLYQHVDGLYKRSGGGWTLVPSADLLGELFNKYYYEVWASDPICDPDMLGTGWQVNDYGYINGRHAMIECGPWLRGMASDKAVNESSEAQKLLTEKTGVAHLPRIKSGNKGTYLEIKGVMVNKYTEVPNLAFDAASLFASPESLRQLREATSLATPVHKKVESSFDDPDWKKFAKIIETGKPLSKITWGPVRQAFYPLMQQVAYGKKDPSKAGKQFHDKLKQLESKV